MDNQETLMPVVFSDLKESAIRAFDALDISESSRKDYQYRIRMFSDFIESNGLNPNTFIQFKQLLKSRTDYSISTKNKYLNSARVFLKELNRRGSLPMDITQNVKQFTQNKKHKMDGLNTDEVNSLSSSIRGLDQTPNTSRLKAILSLLIYQGLRQIEVSRLDVDDLDLNAKKAFICGKGRDDKELIHLHPDTVRILKDYMQKNRISSGPLFQSQAHNYRGERLTTRAIREIVSSHLNSIGIEKTVHGCRHYFTTQLVKEFKGDLLKVAKLTRHKNLEMLQVYNDEISSEADLPVYYGAFSSVSM